MLNPVSKLPIPHNIHTILTHFHGFNRSHGLESQGFIVCLSYLAVVKGIVWMVPQLASVAEFAMLISLSSLIPVLGVTRGCQARPFCRV